MIFQHECSHIFVGDFLATYHTRLEAIRHIFLESPGGEKHDDKEWENEMEELLVRACVARIIAVRNGVAAGNKECKLQAGGYKYITGLYKLLGKYSANRHQYKAIQDFYPEIMAWFEKIATSAG